MNWLGDFPEDFTTVAIYFTTHDVNGAPVAPLSGFETADVIIYKNGSGTQKTSTNGLTMTSPFDSIVGLHCLVIDTSNDTGDAAFWVTGSTYTVILNPDTETVAGQTVLKVLGTFGIVLAATGGSAPSAATVAAAVWDLDATAHQTQGTFGQAIGDPGADTDTIWALANTNLDAAVTSRMATYTQPTGFLAATFPGTVASTTNITAGTITTTTNVTTVNGLASGVITATAVADGAIDAATFASGALDAVWSTATRLLTAGTNIVLAKGTGITGFNDIAAGAAMTLTAAYDAAKTAATQTSVDDLPTNAELATALAAADDAVLAAVAALNNLSAAGVRTAVGLGSANLDTQLGDLPTNAELATALTTADDAVLAAIAALNNLSQANVRTAVGLGSANLDTQLDALPTNAELATALGTADDAVLAAIAALNNLSAAGVRTAVGLATANLDTQLDALPTNAELSTVLGTADDAVLLAIAALNNISAAQVNTEVDTALADVGLTTTITGRIDAAITSRLASASYTAPDNASVTAIKAKTDNLPIDPADASDISGAFTTVNTTLGTIAGYLNTEVADIKAKTDLIPASPAAAGDVPTADENADALLDRTDAVETGMTVRQAARLWSAALGGKLSGGGTTTEVIRAAVSDSKARVTATVDADGNRTAVATDLT